MLIYLKIYHWRKYYAITTTIESFLFLKSVKKYLNSKITFAIKIGLQSCFCYRIMGKRNKGESQNSDDKRSKRTKGLQNQDHLKNDNATIELSDNVQRANNKPKKIIFDDDGQPATSEPDIDTTKSVKDKNTKKSISTNKKHNKNNKIFFDDSEDQPSQVAANNIVSRQSAGQSNQNEDEIKDEDIDKFCDEVEEEDNVQYENWVKLIEEKLTSNKKKS